MGIDGVAADRRHADLVAQAEKDLERGAPEQAEAKLRAVLAENPGFDASQGAAGQGSTRRAAR